MWWNHGDSYNGTKIGKTDKKVSEYIKDSMPDLIKNTQSGIPVKSLLLQNFRLVQRMIDEQQWILRNIIIWHKPNCMPSSVKDRFTVDFEPVFFFTKSKKYWFETQYERYVENSDMAYRKKLRCGRKYGVKRPYQDNQPLSHSKTPAIVNPQGRNKRCVWKIPTKPFSEAHFAVFPEELIETPIKAGCPQFICKKCGVARNRIIVGEGGSIGKSWHEHKKDMEVGAGQISRIGDCVDKSGKKYRRVDKGLTDCGCKAGFKPGIVLDLFMGAGTTALVAQNLGRNYIGIELSKEYIKIAKQRLSQKPML